MGWAGMEGGMRLACISVPGRGATDVFLAEVAARLMAQGLALSGTVQTNIARCDRAHCDMDLRVLPDGPVLRISQDLGAEATGCRLDGGVLEQAAFEVGQRMAGADLLIVNKFGKQEAAGRGLTAAIAEALADDLPVLVGVNSHNRPAFDRFSAGLAQELAPDVAVVVGWCLAGRAGRAA